MNFKTSFIFFYILCFLSSLFAIEKPKFIRGIHIMPWCINSNKFLEKYKFLAENTEINTFVITIKEINSDVYIDASFKSKQIGAYKKTFNIKKFIDYLHKNNIFVVARISTFLDPKFSDNYKEASIKTLEGEVWRDYKGNSWCDPESKEVWEYNFSIVDKCIEIGFDEIQFDYIRYPSDGDLKNFLYYDNPIRKEDNVLAFVKELHNRYSTKINIGIDVFGLSITSKDGLGIGQNVKKLISYVDRVYPMIYPSHYARGTYGIKSPNRDIYKLIDKSMIISKKRLGENFKKIVPYIQAFDLYRKYTKYDILDEVQALYDNDVGEWILWHPVGKYDTEIFQSKFMSNRFINNRLEILELSDYKV